MTTIGLRYSGGTPLRLGIGWMAMNAKSRRWFTSVVTLALASSALAETMPQRQIVVGQGQVKRFAVYINTLADCSSGPLPTIRLTMPPAHGVVRIARGTFKGTNIKQ